jgi:hypothetical protein
LTGQRLTGGLIGRKGLKRQNIVFYTNIIFRVFFEADGGHRYIYIYIYTEHASTIKIFPPNLHFQHFQKANVLEPLACKLIITGSKITLNAFFLQAIFFIKLNLDVY